MTGKVVIAHGSVEFCEARRTETYVAPRHVDALRDFYLFCFIRTSSGGCAARLFPPPFFSCSADHELDWLPCKVLEVVFFGLATNTLSVKNNHNDKS